MSRTEMIFVNSNIRDIGNSKIREALSYRTQMLLNWFCFFLAFPVIDIFGLSITFFIFIAILENSSRNGRSAIKSRKGNIWFWLFLGATFISTIFHPTLMNDVNPFVTFKGLLQYTYWILVALFMYTNYRSINWYQLSKYIFFGLFLFVFCFHFIPVKLSNPVFSFDLRQTRNGVVFNTLNFFPLIFWYIRGSGLKKFTWLIILFFTLGLLFSNGRAGFLLIIIETLLVGTIIGKWFKPVFKWTIYLLLLLSILWIRLESSPVMEVIANYVETVNPRAASLIGKSGVEGDLDMDKSWLLRELMVDKALEIANKYPFFGVGLFNFTNYDADLASLGTVDRLGEFDTGYYNTRSAHNSYAQQLAEGGLIGLVLLLILLAKTIKPVLHKLLFGRLTMEDLPLICILTLSIYFYAISSLTGAGSWFIIGSAFAFAKARVRNFTAHK